jgi:hypothetical protein
MEMIGGTELEGLWFYWVGWIVWVITTFFMKKGKMRNWLAFLVLMLLNTAHLNLNIMSQEVTIGFLLLICLSYIASARLKVKTLVYIVICTIILCLAYVSFHLFSLYDPVWVVFNPKLMVGILLTYLVIILTRDLGNRFLLFTIGACHGEVVYQIILSTYQFPYTIGSLSFFDIVAVGIVLISLWSGLEIISSYFNHLQQKQAGERLG